MLQDEASIWINALQNARCSNPIPFPNHADLTRFPLERLKSIAYHTVRLKNNWDRPFPKITAPVRSTKLGYHTAVVALIPGTSIILLTTLGNSQLVCWDASTSSKFGPSLEIGGDAISSSSFEMEGRYNLALFSDSGGYKEQPSLSVFCIEYHTQSGKPTSFSQIFHQDIEQLSSVFIFEDVVGAVIEDPENFHSFSIISFNINTNEKMTHPLQIGSNDNVSCYILNGDLQIASESNVGEGIALHTYSRDALPYGPPLKRVAEDAKFAGKAEHPSSWPTEGIAFEPGAHAFGLNIHAINIHHTFQGNTRNIVVRIWTSEVGSAVGPCTDHTISFGGAIDNHLTAVGLSKMNVLMVTEENRHRSLKLVRYTRETGRMTVHDLAPPPSINLGNVISISLDDYKGVAHLITTSGDLHSLPYF
jgi:hypothetical protein